LQKSKHKVFQNSHQTIDQFYPGYQGMRETFVKRFENPLKANADRFCWDYWYVPNQYRLLRTPADQFFGKKLFQPFLDHLLAWGRENLGCQMISHPWLSLYLDGHYQALHSDVPHGPYSFVYSLTPWKNRTFTGGETILTRPLLLNYLAELTHDQSHEQKDFFERIEPIENRLTLFDPRYPHGVERVQGALELNQARVVIHGWFTEPRPMVEGALTPNLVMKGLDTVAQTVMDTLAPLDHFGLLSLRFLISAEGKIEQVIPLCAHLINASGEVLALKTILKSIPMDVTFPKSKGATTLTLPLEFRR
jgi:hypothetical protein